MGKTPAHAIATCPHWLSLDNLVPYWPRPRPPAPSRGGRCHFPSFPTWAGAGRAPVLPTPHLGRPAPRDQRPGRLSSPLPSPAPQALDYLLLLCPAPVLCVPASISGDFRGPTRASVWVLWFAACPLTPVESPHLSPPACCVLTSSLSSDLAPRSGNRKQRQRLYLMSPTQCGRPIKISLGFQACLHKDLSLPST